MKPLSIRLTVCALLLLAMMLTPTAVLQADPIDPIVTSSGDTDDGVCDGDHCTLREAIHAANANPGRDTIRFAIPGAGPHTIRPNSALPALTDPVTIDGYTQGDAHPNTNPRGQGLNTLLRIEIDGSNAGNVNGITLAGLSSGSMIRGLAINRFGGSGIELSGNGAMTITGNFVGTDVNGTLALGNRLGIGGSNSFQNTIGGTTAEASNLISGNWEAGIALFNHFAFSTFQGNFIGTDITGLSKLGNGKGVVVAAWHNTVRDNLISGNNSHGIDITGSHSNNTLIEGNWIGTDVTGMRTLGNGGSGIYSRGTMNTIDKNVIWGNQENGITGISGFYATPLRGNSIFANAKLGIDAGDNGVTPNQPGGASNYPSLSATKGGNGETIIEAALNGTSTTTYVLEFFANSACDPSGYGEGQLALKSPVTVTTDAQGNVTAKFTTTLPADKPFVTAVSTDAGSNYESSEFSPCIVGSAADAVVVNSAADPGDGICDADECTLREAVTASNLAPGGTIRFALTTPNTITLTAGEVVISKSLTIAGPGAGQLTISGNRGSRVFRIEGNILAQVHIGELTIEGGSGIDGAGIYNTAGLVLSRTTFVNNTAAFLLKGGALYNAGTAMVVESHFDSNDASDGGAIYNATAASLVVEASEFRNNTTRFRGGALYNAGSASVSRVLMTGNSDSILNSGVLNLSNSTVSGNRLGRETGGLHNLGALILQNVTIAGNEGAGIKNSGNMVLRHVLLANPVNCVFGPSAGYFFSLAPNLASDETCNLTAPGDLSGVDPLLGPLQDNGGPTWTHALLPGSPAIDAGENAACLALDQRGVQRPQPEGGTCDIGAFEAIFHALTVTVTGDGSGTVTPGIGVHSYYAGTTVTIHATAAAGSAFAGWSGACAGQNNPCMLPMDSSKAVTATFTHNTHRLTVITAGDGSGTVAPPAGMHTYFEGDNVSISATASADSNFTIWSGACTGQGNPCMLTMDSDKEVTAHFARNVYSIAVAKIGEGSGHVVSTPPGIDCGGSCAATFVHGTAVTFAAAAAADSHFDGWSGACSGAGVCTVTLDAAKSVTATFSRVAAPIIEVDGVIEVGKTAHFTATLGMSSFESCEWDFGDGSKAPCETGVTAAEAEAVNAIVVTATHTYAAEGAYTVRVAATNAAGTVQAELEVEIKGATAVELYLPVLGR
jgi:CSLREA domain-containing protein